MTFVFWILALVQEGREALHILGHRNIDALDLSPESLKVLKEKGVYKKFIQGPMASENSQGLQGVMENEYEPLALVYLR